MSLMKSSCQLLKAYLKIGLLFVIVEANSQDTLDTTRTKRKFFISKIEFNAGLSSVTQTGFTYYPSEKNDFESGYVLTAGLVHTFSKHWRLWD